MGVAFRVSSFGVRDSTSVIIDSWFALEKRSNPSSGCHPYTHQRSEVMSPEAGPSRVAAIQPIRGVNHNRWLPPAKSRPRHSFFITLEQVIHKVMSLKYEPSSEPLHISAK